MASMSIHCGSNCNFPDSLFGSTNPNDRPFCLTMRNQTGTSINQRGKVSAMVKTPAMTSLEPVVPDICRLQGREETGVSSEKLDEWMMQSVLEIVRNLGEAPLLVHVYGKDKTTGLQTKKAVGQYDWAIARGKWKTGKAPMPEGIIFVEELVDDPRRGTPKFNEDDGVTKIWGIVIQGKGVESESICYLLKTTSVRARLGGGCGMGCTHFCLMRVNDFRETAESQLKNCYLVQAHGHQARWYY